MLALATHELHFSILREDVLTMQEQAPISESTLITSIQNAKLHYSLAKSSGDRPKPFFDSGDKMLSSLIQPQHYQFLHIWILREYLELDMQIDDPPENFVYDIERVIDDFVFLCFFVGNDFLPHMPTLDIHEELNERLKNRIRKKSDLFRHGKLGTDKVKLGSLGWKLRYYKHKFNVEDSNGMENVRKEIVHKYTEGLCWVLLYYYSGIPSWNWYYPKYYGPFASDLKGLASVKVRFQKGSPFKPFDQLMAVLPPKSAHALPTVYQELMTDSCSSIIKFYPIDFEVDVDGKRFLWQGICKLPFIDEEKLLNATKQAEQKVMDSEAARNVQSTNKSFTRDSNSFKRDLGCYLQQQTTIEDDIMCFNFELPAERFHIPRLLEGIQLPIKKIFENDIKKTVPWHEHNGRPPITRRNERYNKTAAVDAGTTIKTAGPGRGFESAGRGKGTGSKSYLPHNGNLKYVRRSDNIHSTSTFPRNVNRSFENLRIQNSHRNRSTYDGTCNTSTHNSFWRSSNENASWRPVSQTRPSFSSQGGEGSSMQFRPCYANTPHQFMGRGRGQSGPQTYNRYSSELPGSRKDCNRW
uniref:Xrn1 helical domain-containing protein n=1 Tax=Chenopodium quinoa TaxID=63459 RepID=A0A803KR84_CHEQI